MARQKKKGLDYFPFDVDFFEDDKLQFVSARFGLKGEVIAVKLLCKIYKTNGYYYPWGEDEGLLFAKGVGDGVQYALVNDIVHELVKRGFFNKRIFDTFKILTSTGIQERYSLICKQAKRAFEIEKKYDCGNLQTLKERIIPEKPPITPEEKPIIQEDSTQRKLKESKVKEIKGKSVENEVWIEDSCRAFSTDRHALLKFCNDWIEKAGPTGKLETYGPNALIRFMLEDFDKKNNSKNGNNIKNHRSGYDIAAVDSAADTVLREYQMRNTEGGHTQQ